MMLRSKSKIVRALSVLPRYLLALLFAVSAIGKACLPSQFHTFLADVFSIPSPYLTPLQWVVSVMEAIIACLLLFPRTSRLGGYLSFLLLLGFTIVLVYAAQLPTAVSCGCFGGVILERGLDESILRNIVFLLIAAYGIVCSGSIEEGGKRL